MIWLKLSAAGNDHRDCCCRPSVTQRFTGTGWLTDRGGNYDIAAGATSDRLPKGFPAALKTGAVLKAGAAASVKDGPVGGLPAAW